MPLSHKLSARFSGSIELQFILDDVDGFRNSVDGSLQDNLVVQKDRLVKTDVLRLYHHIRGGKAHAYEMRDECIQDIAVHDAPGEAFSPGKGFVCVQGIHVFTTALKTLIHLRCYLIGVR